MRLTCRLRPVTGSRPASTISSQEPGDRSRIPGALRSSGIAGRYQTWRILDDPSVRSFDPAKVPARSVGRVGIEPTTQGL